jgi:hypothetical protein
MLVNRRGEEQLQRDLARNPGPSGPGGIAS